MPNRTDRLPEYYRTVIRKLAHVGYVSLIPPRPLMLCAIEDVTGMEAAADVTPQAPLDLGPAQVVAMGDRAGEAVVVHIPGHGDYRGALLHDLFFAGEPVTETGRLLFARDFCVFCFEDCTLEDIRHLMRTIRALTPDASRLRGGKKRKH